MLRAESTTSQAAVGDAGWTETFDGSTAQALTTYDPRWVPLLGSLRIDPGLAAAVPDPSDGSSDDYAFRGSDAPTGSVAISMDCYWDGRGAVGALGAVRAEYPHFFYEAAVWNRQLEILRINGGGAGDFASIASSPTNSAITAGFYRIDFTTNRVGNAWSLTARAYKLIGDSYSLVAETSATNNEIGLGTQGMGIFSDGTTGSYITELRVQALDAGGTGGSSGAGGTSGTGGRVGAGGAPAGAGGTARTSGAGGRRGAGGAIGNGGAAGGLGPDAGSAVTPDSGSRADRPVAGRSAGSSGNAGVMGGAGTTGMAGANGVGGAAGSGSMPPGGGQPGAGGAMVAASGMGGQVAIDTTGGGSDAGIGGGIGPLPLASTSGGCSCRLSDGRPIEAGIGLLAGLALVLGLARFHRGTPGGGPPRGRSRS